MRGWRIERKSEKWEKSKTIKTIKTIKILKILKNIKNIKMIFRFFRIFLSILLNFSEDQFRTRLWISKLNFFEFWTRIRNANPTLIPDSHPNLKKNFRENFQDKSIENEILTNLVWISKTLRSQSKKWSSIVKEKVKNRKSS